MTLYGSPDEIIKTIHPSWLEVLKSEITSSYFKKLLLFLSHEQKANVVFPPDKMVLYFKFVSDLYIFVGIFMDTFNDLEGC